MNRSCQAQTTGFDRPERAHVLQCPAVLGGRQAHASARQMLPRSVTVPNDPLKTDAILGGDFESDACSHAASMADVIAFGNPPKRQSTSEDDRAGNTTPSSTAA